MFFAWPKFDSISIFQLSFASMETTTASGFTLTKLNLLRLARSRIRRVSPKIDTC